MTVHAYSIYAASEMLGRDRQTLTRLVRHTEPYSKAAGKAKYLLSTFVDLIEAEAKGDSNGKSLADARTRKELAHAEIAERENQVAKGEWVRLEDVGKFYSAQLMVCREIMLTMIGKIGALLGPEAELVARDECYDALHELADPYSDKQRAVQCEDKNDEKEFDEAKKEFEEGPGKAQKERRDRERLR